MATTVVAEDIVQLAEGQTTTVFDTQILLGIPAWILVCAFLFLCLLVVNLYWLFRMKRLASVKGYVTAMAKATQEDVMVFVLSTTRNLTIECLRKRDTLLEFYNKLRISKWFHDSQISVIHIGGKGALVVTENYYRTRDMVSEIALCLACDTYNARVEEHEKEQKAKGLKSEYRQIKDYDDYVDFGRDFLGRIFKDGIEIPSYTIFDPQKFSKYFPKGLTSMFYGGVIIRNARKKKVTAKQQGILEKYLGLGMFLTIGLICVIAAWMVPLA